MGRRVRLLLLLTAFTLASGPLAAAQVFLNVDERQAHATPGEPFIVALRLNNPTDREYVAFGTIDAPTLAGLGLEPSELTLPPRSANTTNLSADIPDNARPGSHEVHVTFTIVDRATGDTLERSSIVQITIDQPRAYLGLFRGLTPAPFDAGWGLFLLEAITWALLGAMVSFVGGRLLGYAAPRSTAETRAHMNRRIRTPLWLLTFLLGIGYSWRLVPHTTLVIILDRSTRLIVVVVGAFFVYRTVSAALVYYERHAKTASGARATRILVTVLEKLLAVAVGAFVVVYGLRLVGVDLAFLLAGGVVVGLVLSFAAQDTLSNFFSGIFLLIDRPFTEGEEIRLETGDVCRVDRIGLRSTRLFHFRHDQQMIVPNNELASKRVVNMSRPDGTYRLHVEVEVGYRTDLRKAIQLVFDATRATPDVVSRPGKEPVVYLREFGDSGILMQLRAYVPSSRHRNPVRTALMLAIKDAFDAHGIEIPFPQRDVWMRSAARPDQEPDDA